MRSSGYGKPLHLDSGLQPERTALAWGRTSLALVVFACFLLRWVSSHGWAGGGVAGLCLLLALYVRRIQKPRYRSGAAGVSREQLNAAVRPVLLVGAVVTAMAALSVWVVLRS